MEDKTGNPLSPYAVTKLVKELYADVFAKTYDFKTIGLRYFNIFGKRQDPDGAYAAVIPKWVSNILNGDGKTSRDFCYIDNAVQMNILAAMTEDKDAVNQVYNVAVGDRTSLDGLYELIAQYLADHIKGEVPSPRRNIKISAPVMFAILWQISANLSNCLAISQVTLLKRGWRRPFSRTVQHR